MRHEERRETREREKRDERERREKREEREEREEREKREKREKTEEREEREERREKMNNFVRISTRKFAKAPKVESRKSIIRDARHRTSIQHRRSEMLYNMYGTTLNLWDCCASVVQ